MSHRRANAPLLASLLAIIAIGASTAQADDHLLLTEGALAPTADQFIEIGNATTSPIPLGDHYLTDNAAYALLPGAYGDGPAPMLSATDFIGRFPARAVVPASGVVTVAINGAGYFSTFGVHADFEVLGTDPATPDLLEAYPGSIGGFATFATGGEGVAIFRWDGLADLVEDVDMVRLGVPTGLDDIASKTGVAVDGPDADSAPSFYLDDALSMPYPIATPGSGLSAKRATLELLREVHTGGNGVTGDDETTEDIEVTWAGAFTSPSPGTSGVINPQSGVVLAVAKTGDTTATAGTEMTYTLFIQNSGTDPAFNVLVTDTLPAGLSFVSESSPPAVNNFDTTGPTISWAAGTLAAGDSFSIDLTVLVDIGLSGSITNGVEVFTTSRGDATGDNTDTHHTTVFASFPALSMLKVGPASADADGDIVYTLTIENTGAGPAEDVEVVDSLPPGLSFVSESSPVSVSVTDVIEPSIAWDLGTVMPGAVIEIDLTVAIDAAVAGDIENFATVTTSSSGDNPTDNTDSFVTTVIAPDPDISIIKSGPAMATAGTNIVYALDLRNNGSGPAADVFVTDTLPAGLTYVSHVAPPGVTLIDATPPDIVWDVGTVGPGVILSIDVTTAIDLAVSGNITNTGELSTTSPGDDPLDNTDTADTFVATPPPALSVTKTAPAKAFPGMELDYTIVVENTGAGPAENVVITDTLPADLTFIGESSPPSVILTDMTAPTISWNAGTLAPGAMVTIDLTAAIGAAVSGVIINDVTVTTTTAGEDPADNTDTAATDVLALLPMLTLTKNGPASAVNDTEITYTIFVQNTGNSSAQTVRIIDTLPAGVSVVSESSPAGVSFSNIGGNAPLWTVGTLASFGTVTVELTVAIDPGLVGTIVNSAEVTTTTPDEDPAGNIDTAMTNVSDPGVVPEGIVINEIRINQPGMDKDEYFELAGDPGASLDAITYVVIGDTGGGVGSGGIEAILELDGFMIRPDGLFVVAEESFSLPGGATIDFETNLPFEENDNVTHLLVFEFTGSIGTDTDTDDDGSIDVAPWTSVLDAIGLLKEPNPPSSTEYGYGAALGFEDLGPDGTDTPAHVYRCVPAGTWQIGAQDEGAPNAVDTPDADNEACPCIGDTNGDNVVNIDDIVNVVLCFDSDGIDCPTAGDRSDVDRNGMVNIDDIVQVVLNLGPCP